MYIKYAKKLSLFMMWLLHVQVLGGQNRYGLVWAVMVNPPEQPINDEARNIAHTTYASSSVRQRWPWIRSAGVDSGRILRFSFGPGV